jgi:hypothetical protein
MSAVISKGQKVDGSTPNHLHRSACDRRYRVYMASEEYPDGYPGQELAEGLVFR